MHVVYFRMHITLARRKKCSWARFLGTSTGALAPGILARGVFPDGVASLDTDGARGSLALMSNESMIRGGGPEAWRYLDLAAEAKSKPRCPLLRFPRRSLFATSASSYSRLVLLLF